MTDGIVESSFFKIIKYQRVNLFEHVPALKGIHELTKAEIRKDLRDIERSFVVDDSDSDSSIQSEDILPSTYPVKPRKTRRLISRNETRERQIIDDDRERQATANADDALNFLRAIKMSKKEIFNNEVERERLEALHLSYDYSSKQRISKVSQIKKEQENYLQLMQALCARQIKQNILYNRQNVMIYDVIEALQRRKQAVEVIEAETKKSKAYLQGKGQKSTSLKHLSPIVEGETAFLRVYLKRAGKEVILFKGMWLKTPMGHGQIISIHPGDSRVVIRLPFGKMFSRLERVVCWGGLDEHLDTTSDKALLTQWLSFDAINMPIDKKIGIRLLLGPTDDVEDTTDGDDDASDNAVAASSAAAAEPTPAVVDENPAMLALQDALTQDADQKLLADITSESDRELRSAAADSLVGKLIFPMTPAPSANSRSKITKAFRDDMLSNAVDIRSLPLVFAPPAAIPSVLETLDDSKREHRMEIWDQAFSRHDRSKVGSSAALSWSGDINEMEANNLGNHSANLTSSISASTSAKGSMKDDQTNHEVNGDAAGASSAKSSKNGEKSLSQENAAASSKKRSRDPTPQAPPAASNARRGSRSALDPVAVADAVNEPSTSTKRNTKANSDISGSASASTAGSGNTGAGTDVAVNGGEAKDEEADKKKKRVRRS